MAQNQAPAGSGDSFEIEVLVSGRVVNGTSGESGAAEQEVALNRIVGERVERVAAVKTGVGGDYSFPQITVESEVIHFLSTNYAGIDYFSAPLQLRAQTQVSSEIRVYEITRSDELIRVNAHHIIMEDTGDAIQVREFLMFANTGNRTLVGSEGAGDDGGEVLRFIIPTGIVEPEINQGINTENLANTMNGFADRSVFRAGSTKEIVFGYKIPFGAPKHTFSKQINYPTDKFQFLAVNTGIDYRSADLTPSEPAQIGDKDYLVFVKEGVKANDVMTIAISGLPVPRDDNFIRLVVMGSILGLGIFALAFYLFSAERRAVYAGSPQLEGDGTEEVQISLEEKRQELIKSIANLDDRYEAGKIREWSYSRQRSDRKEELVHLTQQLRALEQGSRGARERGSGGAEEIRRLGD